MSLHHSSSAGVEGDYLHDYEWIFMKRFILNIPLVALQILWRLITV